MSEVKRTPFAVSATVQRETHAAPFSRTDWARRYQSWLRATDSLVILCAVFVAYVLRGQLVGIPLGTTDAIVIPGILTTIVVGTWYAALSVYRTRDAHVVGHGTSEYKRVVGASAIAFGLLSIAFLIGSVEGTRSYFVIALPFGLLGLLTSRWMWRRWLVRQRIYENYLSRALVVGSVADVESVVRQIQAARGSGYAVVGAAVDGATTGAILTRGRPVPIVADLDSVQHAVHSVGADTVIVAGRPRGGSKFIRTLSWQLEGTASELVLAAPLTDVAGPRIHFHPVEGLPLIHVEIPQFEGGKHLLKRALDIVASGAAIIVLFPLLVAIAIAIKLDSPGPALFAQERVGRRGKPFRMLKFRSMVVTAEQDLASLAGQNQANGLLFKMKNDPRVTRVGRVLRKYSLDEFPQLWNILIGQMSLVGPRPPLEREVSAYEDHVRRRLYIKPGLTGMWQIGGRSDLSWEESVRLDLYYVENWSLTGDVIILWRTFRTVFRPVGAY